ncbi:acyl-CoA-binding domain-containing protein 5 [Hyalella azteca]|uniref:Acyl-CoA-binding domain-containing protein 5 n=1 Tax=Hyalella azteca TaxID=294128 RepID=A0A8B7NZS1_HYAAZ|nr:acyl-CoA-binding domain-containing protein 5 [Hyalella azteca]
MTTEEKFQAAVNVIKGLPKDGPYQPSNEMKQIFYGLYKQATEGPCTEPKPPFYQVIAGYKWRAWNSLGNISKEEAMEKYVAELKKIIETMSYSADVASFMEALGPFYDYVEMPSKEVSIQSNTIIQNTAFHQHEQPAPESDSFRQDIAADATGPLQYEVAEKLVTNGIHEHKVDNADAVVYCHEQDKWNKVPLKNGFISNGDVKRNGVVSKSYFMGPNSGELPSVASSAQNNLSSAQRQDGVRPNKSAAVYSDTDSEEEYAMPPEELSGDECVVINGNGLPNKVTNRKGFPTLNCNSREQHHPSGLTGDESASDSSSICELNNHIPTGTDQQFAEVSAASPASAQCTSRGRAWCASVTNKGVAPQSLPGLVTYEQGQGGGGGDDVVIVLRQMQGDLQAMTRCLQAHLNDISQCLVALNRTSIALQAHSDGAAGGGGGGGGSSPDSEVAQRRQRQWWPFPELSPRSTFWLLLWPVLLHVALSAAKLAIKIRRRRKANVLNFRPAS